MEDAFFHGAVSMERVEEGCKPWRIPYAQRALFPVDGLGGTAEAAAGVRLAFNSDTNAVHLQMVPSAEDRQLDCVLSGGEIHASVTVPAGSGQAVFDHLPPGSKDIEIYLPANRPIVVRRLQVDQEASVLPLPRAKPRWVTYGSSITQCAGAASPALTWPAIAARKLGWDLTCLGYSGNCHMEPMLARMIRDLDADVISLCLGINIMGQSSLSMRTFRSSVIGMVSIIREKHPSVPIALMSPIYSPDRETTDNAVGMNLVRMRQEIGEAVQALASHGDANLHYIDGLEVFGETCERYLPDRLHPNAEGYQVMAGRMVKQLERLRPGL